MTGQVHWFPIIILLVAVSPVLALWITGWLADRHYRVEHRSVRCRPRGNKLVECAVVREADSGQAIGIRSCTANVNPEDVRCERTCLPLFAKPA
jgi:hypothetical protein